VPIMAPVFWPMSRVTRWGERQAGQVTDMRNSKVKLNVLHNGINFQAEESTESDFRLNFGICD
jgi:hypothetical protein